jgi:N-acetylglutamate synthase-like GNAT family acetyltransferase
MLSTMTIRPAMRTDVSAISDLILQLGYPVNGVALAAMLGALLDDPRHAVVVAEEADHGMVAMLALSVRSVLRLQGWVGSIEELVVRQGLRDRGVGDRLIQYAKGLAAERGWARLEIAVARKRESNRRSFLFSRGFVTAESVTYRWGMLEKRHQAPPVLQAEGRPALV